MIKLVKEILKKNSKNIIKLKLVKLGFFNQIILSLNLLN